MRIGITLHEAQLEIWPIDDWSRKQCIQILTRHQIGFQYVPTTMNTMAFRFYDTEDYLLAKGLFIDNPNFIEYKN